MSERAFNPNDHLMKVRGGADYLEVKWRLVWFRADHPDGIIETELIREDEKSALFKATVRTPDLVDTDGTIYRGGSATGYGSETVGDFKDFIEKAETKAIGRALAALGYGTQFAPDMDDGSANDRPVDAPVQRQDAPPRNRSTSRNTVPDAPQSPVANKRPAQVSEHPTMDQRALTAIFALTNQRGVSNDDLHTIVRHRYGVESLKQLRVDHGRDLYTLLQKSTDDDLKHELWLANGSPEPAQAEMMPDTAGRARA